VAALAHALPSPALRDKAWHLAFRLTRDGASAATLVAACAHHATYLLVVEDSYSYVFGAAFSHALTEATGQAYYGTGETWLFSFHHRSPQHLRRYPWTAANELLALTHGGFGLAFGGGGGFGLHLDGDLDNGASSPCATFGNARLSSAEFFKTLNVEVWRLDATRPQAHDGSRRSGAAPSGLGRSSGASSLHGSNSGGNSGGSGRTPSFRGRGFGPHPPRHDAPFVAARGFAMPNSSSSAVGKGGLHLDNVEDEEPGEGGHFDDGDV
jgi:hypothetical protein